MLHIHVYIHPAMPSDGLILYENFAASRSVLYLIPAMRVRMANNLIWPQVVRKFNHIRQGIF